MESASGRTAARGFLLCTAALAYAQASTIVIEDFSAARHEWEAMNDPVMGGQSYSSVAVQNDVLNFTGSCEIVPSLQAPGFITARNSDSEDWADVSSCKGLSITAKAATNYAGYRISFGHAHPIGGKFFAYGYKANMRPTVGSFETVSIPFTNFTDFWDDATGDPIHSCISNPRYCPDMKTLGNMKTMSIWAEGVKGKVHLEVKTIAGYGC